MSLPRPYRSPGRRVRLAAAAAAALAGASPLGAQESPVASSPPALSVAPGWSTAGWVDGDAPLELRLAAPLPAGAGRLAVVIGRADATGLFRAAPSALTYRRPGPRLPAGETELAVFLVAPDGGWAEVGRFPLRVRTALGLETALADPRLELRNKGQLAQGQVPDDADLPDPERATFQDVTFSGGLQTTHARGSFALRTQANLVGVSHREEALRFGELSDSAPRLDLSDFLIELEAGRMALHAGHVSFGASRHLISGFGSRGLTAAVPLGPAARLSVAGMNGTSIVGYDNFLGLRDADHRILGAGLDLELVPARPGALQLGVTAMDGSVLPLSGFNEGAVNDAEESRGASVRLAAADGRQRVVLEAGYARSAFTNPEDPTITPEGGDVVPVEEETRAARYLDLTLNLLQSVRLAEGLEASLAAAGRHERVDPLYRSLGAYAQADRLENAVDLTGSLGQVNARFSHARSSDNLGEVASILTTRTRATILNLAVPLGFVVHASDGTWLPLLSYGFGRTHQFGDGIPPNSGFDASHVPDQLSTSHDFAAEWQGGTWRFGYRGNRVFQDSRQRGREESDFRTGTDNLTFGLTPAEALELSLDVSFERQRSLEVDQEDLTRRVGLGFNWRFTASSAIAVLASRAVSRDKPGTSERSDADLSIEFSQRIPLFWRTAAGPPAQFFVRYTSRGNRSVFPASRPETQRDWRLNTGLNLTAF